MKKFLSCVAVIIVVAFILTFRSSNSKLSDSQVKDSIKTYMAENGQLYWQTYDDIAVIDIQDRRTTEYQDDVTFYIEYNDGLYATTVAHFTKYDQGWLIDSVDEANYVHKH